MIGVFSSREKPFLDDMQSRGIPVVTISEYDPPEGFPLVGHDNFGIGALAARHLIDQGLNRFAYVPLAGAKNNRGRKLGFFQTIIDAGFSPPALWNQDPDLFLDLQKSPKPVGVFCFNDHRARHLQRAAVECGIAIPSEVASIGVDNDLALCELCPIPQSSIVLNFDAVGFRAAEILNSQINGLNSAPPETRIPPIRVEVRQSTEFLVVEDALVRRSLAFIEGNMEGRLTVGSIAEEMGVSPRHLQYRFSAATQSSIGAEIRRIRLERAKKLLLETGLRVQEIAWKVGYPDINRFSRYFKSRFGQSPSHLRKCSVQP
jgi:LacI family transcriptional regulator